MLSTKLEGDFFFSRSDAEKSNKAAIKAKKKAEKEEAKAAAKAEKEAAKAAAKAGKSKKKGSGDGGGEAAGASKGRFTPAQTLQDNADSVKKLSKQASQLGAHAASNALEKGDATIQYVTGKLALYSRASCSGLVCACLKTTFSTTSVKVLMYSFPCLLRQWVQGCAGTTGCEQVKIL